MKKHPKSKPQAEMNFNKRLAAYSAGAAAALGVGMLPADAAIHYVDETVVLDLGSHPGWGGSWWRLEGASGAFLANAAFTSYSYAPGYFMFYSCFFPAQASNGFRFADNLWEGIRRLNTSQSVSNAIFTGSGDGSRWVWDGSGAKPLGNWGEWHIGEPGFAGFRFTNPDDGEVNYGWAQITLLPWLDGVEINTWAWEDDGSPIQVGAIPEPAASVLLMATGAAGIAAFRRRRKAQK